MSHTYAAPSELEKATLEPSGDIHTLARRRIVHLDAVCGRCYKSSSVS
ncbi:hypothetical protein AG1IA_08379 [Rhizoctonia solani AG-1 IA]|uniref:Uncharacterized protein n=1 Tax=Thanatephorus cucumeris (strain AG1-IA) TaxID=983506 RepID=L8WH94_THACA|nr:hypothetical protein AG1IA_08379 [Rhizoctonia solani AG-1 IA]